MRNHLYDLASRCVFRVLGPIGMRTPICTFSGQHFDPLARRSDELIRDINFIDIAHGLSNLCRFNGQTEVFYSVAQHSLMVCDLVPDELKLEALMHDATEAYLGDMVKPLKLLFPIYWLFESRVMKAIEKAFGLASSAEIKNVIRSADMIALATERRDLMPNANGEWHYLDGFSPLPDEITPMSPTEAKNAFIQRFEELARARSLTNATPMLLKLAA